MPSLLGQQHEMRRYQNRFQICLMIFGIFFLLVVGRIWYLQIMRGTKFYKFSEQNFLKQEKIVAPRGMVFDRNGTILVDNYPSFDVIITPQFLPMDDFDKIVEMLSRFINLSPDDIRFKLAKAKNAPRFQPVVIKSDVTQDEVGLIKSHSLELLGVDILPTVKRTYLTKEVGASLLGYLGEINQKELDRLNKTAVPPYEPGDMIGKGGIEIQFETILRGIDGAEYTEVDAFGRRKLPGEEILLGRISEKPDVPGNNLVLTIDQQLQNIAYEAFGDKIGALVALDPNTGEILSMVSKPSFNPTDFSRGVDPEIWKELLADPYDPLRNKAIQNHYPPGSAYKPLVLLAGLQNGSVTLGTTVFCPGGMQFGKRFYRCWKKEGHGTVNVDKSIAESCDVFYYRAGISMGIDPMSEKIMEFGLGKKTGVDLPGEVEGLIPTKEWKEQRLGKPWLPGETLSQSIGQGYVLVTPIQLAASFGGIANGGKIFKPNIIKTIESPEGEVLQKIEPTLVRQVSIPEPFMKATQEALFDVVNKPGGTAYWTVRVPGLDIAGKTGTVQVIRMPSERGRKCEETEFRFRDHGWFVGYAPIDDPKIVVAAIVEHGCHGSSGAGPIVKAVISKYLEGKISPEKARVKPTTVKEIAPKSVPDEEEDIQGGPDEIKKPQGE